MSDLKYPLGRFEPLDTRWNLKPSENIEYLAQYPSLLQHTISDLTDDQMETAYRPEGWTVTQLVHHISDSHMNAYIRFKLALTEDHPIIKPYEEAEWAKLPDTHLELIDSSINLLKAVHTKWTALMKAITESDWTMQYQHPADGSYVTLSHARQMYHWHSAHHLAHITRLIERKEW